MSESSKSLVDVLQLFHQYDIVLMTLSSVKHLIFNID